MQQNKKRQKIRQFRNCQLFSHVNLVFLRDLVLKLIIIIIYQSHCQINQCVDNAKSLQNLTLRGYVTILWHYIIFEVFIRFFISLFIAEKCFEAEVSRQIRIFTTSSFRVTFWVYFKRITFLQENIDLIKILLIEAIFIYFNLFV